MDLTGLPPLDEHTLVVGADAGAVWVALLTTVEQSFAPGGAQAFARLVGCADTRAGGPRPLDVGSTLPGFHVTAAEPGRLLALEGRHRFSTYALVFRLDAAPGGTTLRAQSLARFPGITGRAYRLAVLRTGAHVLGVRRLLRGVQRRAEA
jgi:hypothetical protein